MRVNLRGVAVQSGECPRQPGVAQPARAVDTFAEPHDLHPPDDVDEPVAVDVGDEQPDRVGAAVDRRDSRHETDTQGPAAPQLSSRSKASSPKGLTPRPAAGACGRWPGSPLTRFGPPPAATVVPGGSRAPRRAG